jgi:hypothetical protein
MAETDVSHTQTEPSLTTIWTDPDEILRRFQKAVDDAIAEHRRHGRPIAVDRGNGVELIP